MTRSSDSNTVKLNKAYLSTMDFWYELLFSKAILPKHRYTLDHISNTIHVRRMLGIQIYKRYLKQDSQLFRDRKFFPFLGRWWWWGNPHYQSVQRGPADAGRAELIGINIFPYT